MKLCACVHRQTGEHGEHNCHCEHFSMLMLARPHKAANVAVDSYIVFELL